MEGRERAGFHQLDTLIQLVNPLPNPASPLTWLLGGLGQRALHRPAVGIVPTTDPTLVILLQGANLLVTADVLAPRRGEDKPGVTRANSLQPSPSLHHPLCCTQACSPGAEHMPPRAGALSWPGKAQGQPHKSSSPRTRPGRRRCRGLGSCSGSRREQPGS